LGWTVKGRGNTVEVKWRRRRSKVGLRLRD
jgi:hypothetical protein